MRMNCIGEHSRSHFWFMEAFNPQMRMNCILTDAAVCVCSDRLQPANAHELHRRGKIWMQGIPSFNPQMRMNCICRMHIILGRARNTVVHLNLIECITNFLRKDLLSLSRFWTGSRPKKYVRTSRDYSVSSGFAFFFFSF